ncbi:response regulator [Propionivibrio limicola]|uniref:response regulator n=1 Tax=Propionivibrio limicola TaxID=167645 RepID=UPI001292128F|nr:response regulator [Propionivibrio limicola]
MTEHVLIVEDEDKIAAILHDYLVRDGYATHRLRRGDEVVPWLRENSTDLLLLDLMLPGLSGQNVCRALRANGAKLAIIMTTARVEESDRLLGLELGADDYICKPFSPREVVARVKAVLRRINSASLRSDRNAGLALDQARWQAAWHGRDLGLTAIEFKLLKQMTEQPGRIFTREQLMDAMHGDDRIVADRTVDSHIKKIRRKLAEAAPDAELIRSVYGIGYKYEPA